MAVLESLLSRFRRSRSDARKTRRQFSHRPLAEALEPRLLLTNPDPFESNPGAPKTIYLDFDGHVETSTAWQNQRVGSRTVDTPAFSLDNTSTFTDMEREVIEEIWLRVSEDFAPFSNVNVTTIDPGVYTTNDTLLVSIGGYGFSHIDSNDWWSPRRHTHALLDGFNDTTNSSTTVFVFARDYQSHPASTPAGRNGQIGRDVANGVSEAAGIAFGLTERNVEGNTEVSHLVGDGTFALGLRDTWSNVPALGAPQDDLNVITKAANNIIFAPDDHGNTLATATAVTTTANVETLRGLIGRNNDVDLFAFSTDATTASFIVRGTDLTTRLSGITGNPLSDNGLTNPGSNLDPQLRLLDANGVEIALDDQPFAFEDGNSISATINAALPAGNYYLEVSGGGRYGSLGPYTVTMNGIDTPTALGVPPRQSNPGADVTFFLDFNGHFVANPEIVSQRVDMINQPFYVPVFDTDGDRTNFSQQEQNRIVEIWARVAEDFAPFDVNVTTFDPFVYTNRSGLLVAIGGDGTWLGPVGTVGKGFAALSTFSGGTGDNNAVAFSDNFVSAKETALEASAVIGLALGIETYIDHPGGGVNRIVGDPALGPIGGDSLNSLRDTFLQGEGAVQGVIQDPLGVINGPANRILYRPDDHGDRFNTATIVNVTIADEVLKGIIEENGDEDWFSFQTLAADATITVSGLDLTVDALGVPIVGVMNPGANLDPILELWEDVDGNGNLRRLENDGVFPDILDLNDNNPASLKAGFTVNVPAGQYYIRVTTRPGEYGNLGQYTVTMKNVDGTPAVVSFPTTTSIPENAGLVVGVGRVTRPFGQPTTAPLVVNLASTDTTELTVPTQVTILPGQNFVTFDVTAVDDDILDGDQNVIVEARISGVLNSTAVLKVTDHETISASVTPNPVREDAGPAGATLTVTRSNTDIGQANHWVGSGNTIQERNPTGGIVRTIVVEWPVGTRPVAEIVHDVQVMQDGNVAVYNGTGQAFISIYNVTTGTWRHFAEPGLSANTALDTTIGGITSIGDFVFLTDLESFDGDERGIVRLNTVTGQIDRFADSSVGSRLYILSGQSVVEVNAVTGVILNTITPQASIGAFTSLEAIAFDGTNLWVLFDDNSFFNNGGISELQKLNPDTGAIVEVHSVPLPSANFFFSNNEIGMTTLNGLIYFNLPFDNGSSTRNRSIQAYNPVNRQLVGGLFPFEALNSIVAGYNIGSLKGDGTPANPDVLLVHGYPDTLFGGSFFNDRIYLIDPATGRAIGSFVTGTNTGFFFSGGGIGSLDDVIVGTTIRNGLIYLNLADGIHVFNRSGAIVDMNPATSFPGDLVPHAVQFGFDNAEIAAADVPGVTAQELSFRDVTIGVTDSLLYGLVENGTEIAVYEPDTLVFRRVIQLDAVVNAIAVDEDGNILGGGPNGDVRIFDRNGKTIAVLDTTSLTLANVADVDTNISEEVIISDTNGIVIVGPRQAVFANDATLMVKDSATTGTTTFASFGRHSKLPTGPLVVTLTSNDLTELQTPVEVKIPVGQTFATVPMNVIDDNELDGPQIVTISGSAPNYVPDSTLVTVLDAETVGVEIRRDTVLTVRDSSLIADGDRISVLVNNRRTVFEIEDTSVGNGIALSSQHPVNINLSATPTNSDVATAIAAAIGASDIGVTVNSSGGVVTISGAPNFPTVTLLLGNVNAAIAEKPVAETEGLIGNGVRVFRSDVDGPFTVPASTAGAVTVPTPIADNDVTLSQITIVKQVSRVTDINVMLTLQHGFIPDLDITLVSPSGTRVELFTDLGSNESNMTNTILDDEAATRIVDGDAPFTGRFIPKQLLSGFDGENPSGTWTLEVVDDNVTDTGTLLSWSLEIETLGISETQVTLISSDLTEATVTTLTVTIPAARSEVFVDLTAIDDTIVDGTIPVTIRVDVANVSALFDLGADVVDVTDVENLTITLDKLIVSEGDGTNAISGTISRSDTDMTTDLFVNLTSSDTTELLPSTLSVTIPIGQSTATFMLDAVDDPDFDGDKPVTITATAAGYVPAISDVITVTDQEPRLVLTTLTSSIPEDAGTITIFLSRLDATDLSVPLQGTLTSSDPSELIFVTTNFVIGIGALTTEVTATILEDSELDGPQTVTITASDINTLNPAVSSGTLQIIVEDAEFVSITVPAGEESFLENAGTAVTTATVSISSTGHTSDIIVNLTNGDPSEISIPAQVIIPVGETSAMFVIDAVNDSFIDRDQLVAVTGGATGFRDGVLNLTVKDHEPPITQGPAAVVESPTPTISWAPVDGATRYDLWVNDVSRQITQLFRLDSLSPTAPLFNGNFEEEFLDQNNNRTFNPALWESTGAQVDSLALNDPTGIFSAHLNGSPKGGDQLQSVAIDLSGRIGAQLEYSFQRTGQGDSPDLGQDLILMWRNAAGIWIQLDQQPGAGPDMDQFQRVVIQLPSEALHSSFAFRFQSIGQTTQNNVEGVYDDWFIDAVKVSPHETFRPTQEMGVGRYRYWVRAYDDLEQPGFWSTGRNFQIRTRPQMTSPTNNSIVAENTFPEISWTTVVDTARYDLWVNNVTTGQSQVVRQTNLQTTSYASTLANLPGGTYRAWTRAIAPDGLAGFWSAGVTFTVLSAPTGITPNSATFDRTPTFEWDAVEGATNYYIWVTLRNPGQTPVVVLRDRFVTGTSRTPDNDLTDGRYAVWLKAIAANGAESPWSLATEFTIGGRPTIVAPGNDSTTSSRPAFLWTGIDGTERYELWINRIDVPQTRVVYDANVLVTSYAVQTPLQRGTYRGWVRAISEMGEASFWSLPVNFTVVSSDQPTGSTATPPMLLTRQDTLKEQTTSFAARYVVSPLIQEDWEVTANANSSFKPTSIEDAESVPALPVPKSVSELDEVSAVDDVMAAWAAPELWMGETEDSTADVSAAASLGLGLLTAGTVLRHPDRRRTKKS